MNQGAQRYLAQRLSTARERPAGTDVVSGDSRCWEVSVAHLKHSHGRRSSQPRSKPTGLIGCLSPLGWLQSIRFPRRHSPRSPAPVGAELSTLVKANLHRRPAPPPMARFLGLIPVEQSDQALPFGGRVQILGIERYDIKVVVVWRIAPLPDPEKQFASEIAAEELDSEGLPEPERQMMRLQHLSRLRARGVEKLTLSDDVNTEYHKQGVVQEAEGRSVLAGQSSCPPYPRRQGRLAVHWEDIVFDVPLSKANLRGPKSP